MPGFWAVLLVAALSGDVWAASASEVVERARAALAAGELAEAERLAREAEGIDPAGSEAYHVEGLAAFREGRFERAREAFAAEVARVQPGSRAERVAHFNLAGAEFKLGRFAEAESDYRAAAEDPDLAALSMLDAGLSAERGGAHDKARQAFEAAKGLDAGRTVAAEADRLLAEWAEERRAERRDAAWTMAKTARVQLKGGKPAEAVTTLEGALAEADAGRMKAEDRAQLDYALGLALDAAGRRREAAQALRRAVAGAPSDAELRYVLALALDEQQDPEAARELRAAIASGLPAEEAAKARARLSAIEAGGANDADAARAAQRVTVDVELSAGYDSHYAGGRESLFLRGGSQGSPEVALEIEPRLKLFGRPSSGLYLGDRLAAVFYTQREADPFSLIEDDLYLEGSWSPLPWLTLRGTGEGYVETAGVATFAPFQAGALAALRATAYEGERFATRVRYGHTFMASLDPGYDYLGGNRDEVAVAQLVWLGSWRLSIGYRYRHEGVGRQVVASAMVLGATDNATLRCLGWLQRSCATEQEGAGLPDVVYSIPWSYDGHDVGIDGDGALGWGVEAAFGVHYERRDYGDKVLIKPDPMSGYHDHRVDDRVWMELSLKREIAWGFRVRLSGYLLVSRSTIGNMQAGAGGAVAAPFDFDDKNYLRGVATIDLIRPF